MRPAAGEGREPQEDDEDDCARQPEAGEPLRQLGANLLAVNHRHERLIDGLLTLAGSEQRITEHTAVDLADIAHHVAADSADRARDASVALQTDLEPAPLAGDPVLLEQLVRNLVDNAIRYNLQDDGWITIETGVDAGHAVLTVENPGPVVPAHEIPLLFEPFRRVGGSERHANPNGDQGAGLGLSIVRSITHAHDGEVHAKPRSDGGLTIEVRLPARTTDDDQT